MLGNKPPYTTMQQLNLDWILSKLKTLLRLVPDDGAAGQILRRTRDGAVWSDEQGGGGGGAVESVNWQTGAVVLDAADVGALPDDYTPPVTSVNGKTGAVVLDADDVGALPDDYTPPVTSVNGQTGAVVIPTGAEIKIIFSGSVMFTNGYGAIQASSFMYQNPIPVFAVSTLNPTLTFIFGGDTLNSQVNVGMPFAVGYSGAVDMTIYGFSV